MLFCDLVFSGVCISSYYLISLLICGFYTFQEHWATALQTLDLTLDEVIHIRTVLTKAELEGLPLDGSLKDDVEKGKVCFLCMKTRFGFFSRGCKCELCSRQVCAKCSTKVKKSNPLLGLEITHRLENLYQRVLYCNLKLIIRIGTFICFWKT